MVYTTRPDTLFGATYMVLAPEHPYIEKWKDAISNWDAVTAYVEAAAHKSDFERTELVKEKTGVKLEGVRGVNPVNGKEIPIFISDYVLVSYGTGAIMAVPPTTTGTGRLPRSSAARSSRWSREATLRRKPSP